MTATGRGRRSASSREHQYRQCASLLPLASDLISRRLLSGIGWERELPARSGSSPALDSGRIQKPPDSQFGLLGHKVHSYAAFSRAAIRRVPAIYP